MALHKVNDGTYSRDDFINYLYKYNNTTDIYKIIQLETRKNNINFFPCYKKFMEEYSKNSNSFEIENLDAKARHIVYLLAIFYNYKFKRICTEMYESFGYKYSDTLEEDKIYEYSFLKKKRLHNLKFFECVDKENNLWKLRKGSGATEDGESIYKRDVTKEICTIRLIKN